MAYDNEIDSYMESCTLCPRNCGAHRLRMQKGRCHADSRILVARAALHMWEEPCISGAEGSGAVFFCGCSLGCVFCQNAAISEKCDDASGREVSIEQLADIFIGLQEQGANNINLVTAGHYAPQAAEAIRDAKMKGLHIPVVYNSSGYEKVQTLRLLEGLVDIYLPDFKYMNPQTAKEYSGAQDYIETAQAALGEMVRQIEKTEFDSRGMMKKGVIVRHLLLPGHVREAKKVVKYLYETYGDAIYISMMNQYTPMPHMQGHPQLGRKVTAREYESLLGYAVELGVENGFFQEGETAKESFIPEFGAQWT